MTTLLKVLILCGVGLGTFLLGRHMVWKTYHGPKPSPSAWDLPIPKRSPIVEMGPDRFGTRDAPYRSESLHKPASVPAPKVQSVPVVSCTDGACYYDVRQNAKQFLPNAM
jgi:hypothetical protein